MLPQGCDRSLVWLACASLAAGTLLAGCAEPQSPESRVRALIAEGEAAAEARDLSALMDLVSPGFRDEQGAGPDELKQYLRGYLVMHPSVHLLTRVEELDFPYRDFARVRLTVGALGRESAAATAFDVAVDVQEVTLELQLEDGEWKVVRAAWRSAIRD